VYRLGEVMMLGKGTRPFTLLAALVSGAALSAHPVAAQTPTLVVSSPIANPGTRVQITVTLETLGAPVVATQNTLSFDNVNVSLHQSAPGQADCTVNPAIDRGATIFFPQPATCTGSACTSLKVLVFSLTDLQPIADGSVLYTCTLDVAPGASGTSTVVVGGVNLSDPAGGAIPGSGENGTVTILSPSPTATASTTPTFTPTATSTNTVTPTDTATPTWTSTSTVTPTASPTATDTPRPTVTPTTTPTAPPTASSTPTSTPTPTPTPVAACPGDCDGNGRVTVAELLTGVDIFFSDQPLAACPALDSDHDGQITVNDLLKAVDAALNGCPAA
jgi:hypothetical protein